MAKPITCKRCGLTDLKWNRGTYGKFYLTDLNGNSHSCEDKKMGFKANIGSICPGCGLAIHVGDAVNWPRRGEFVGQKYHASCFEASQTQTQEIAKPETTFTPITKEQFIAPIRHCNQCGTKLSEIEAKAGFKCVVCQLENDEIDEVDETINAPQTQENAPMSDPLAATLALAIQPFITSKADAMTEKLAKDIDKRISAATDGMQSRVETAVLDAIAMLKPEVHTIVVKNDIEIARVTDAQHKLFPRLMRNVTLRKATYLWGEAGSGKSTTAKTIATALNLPYYYLALQAQTTKSELMGYMDATGNYVKTDFYRAYSGGGVFLLDELELGNGNLLGSLNGALANGKASFPCGITDRHPDFVCIATGNTPALGATPAYSDRRALDGSVRDRFAFIEWNIDEDLELHLSSALFAKSEVWVKWVQAVRKAAKAISPRLIVTQRASLEGCDLLNAGDEVENVAEMYVFRGFEASSVKSLLASHPLPKL
jgi:MoxR-like ATPase